MIYIPKRAFLHVLKALLLHYVIKHELINYFLNIEYSKESFNMKFKNYQIRVLASLWRSFEKVILKAFLYLFGWIELNYIFTFDSLFDNFLPLVGFAFMGAFTAIKLLLIAFLFILTALIFFVLIFMFVLGNFLLWMEEPFIYLNFGQGELFVQHPFEEYVEDSDGVLILKNP